MGLILALRSDTLRNNVLPPINDDSANRSVRHGTCFHRRLSAHHAGAAPATPVAELGVVRRFCASRGILAEPTLNGYYSRMNYEHLITVEPGKRSGKPCIRGMRITVYDVLEYLASGMTEDEILTDFSELTREDIKACLSFAADRERKLFTAAA